jgi:hypothetical protein
VLSDTGWVYVIFSLILLVICVATSSVIGRLDKLGKQIRSVRNDIMVAVQIEQEDLDAFASTVETHVNGIIAAVGVLGGYIQQLLANQATPMPLADEQGLQTALSDLGANVGNLQALEPPAPPEPPTPPETTP